MTVRDVAYEAIVEGAKATRQYAITAQVYSHFLEAFADRSPIHVDDEYARARGFKARVMHGAILNGFVSHFVGVDFPGRRSLLLSVDLRYSSPSYLDDVIEVRATVAQKVDAHRVIVLALELHNVTQGAPAARGRAQVAIADA